MSSETEKSEVIPKATRYVSPLDEFEKLPVLVWFKYLLNRTGTYVADEKGKISTKKFGAWIQANEINSAPLPLQSSRWSEYINGKRCPSELMLSNMDKIIPGSSIVYSNGDETLPLWSVLRAVTQYWDLKELAEEKLAKTNPPSPQGEVQALSRVEEKKLDTKIINEKLIAKKKKAEKDRIKAADYLVCEKLVNEVLGEYEVLSQTMTNADKCMQMCFLSMNAPLGKEFYEHTKQYSGDIEHMLVSLPNKIADSFEAGCKMFEENGFKFSLKHPIYFNAETNRPQRLLDDYKILNKKLVLSIIALSHICLPSDDKRVKPLIDYMLEGITAGAVEYHFGKDVSDFYENPVIIEPPLVG